MVTAGQIVKLIAHHFLPGDAVSEMLGWRLLLGPLLVVILAAVFWADSLSGPSSPILLGFAALLAIRATWELVALMSVRTLRLTFPVLALLNAAILLINGWPVFAGLRILNPAGASTFLEGLEHLGPAMTLLTLSLMLLLAWRSLRFTTPGSNVESLGAELLCLVYVGGLFSFLAQLRWVQPELGYIPLASMVVAVKFGDIAAYTFGRLLGRAKLIPQLSPGKTWAGAWGALAGSALGTWGFLACSIPWCTSGRLHMVFWSSLVYGVLLGLSGMIGDLCESLLKRDVGQKDSAPLLPGFGGLLDILDSAIYSSPIAYLLWLWLPLAGK